MSAEDEGTAQPAQPRPAPARHRRRRHAQPEHAENADRWLVSYADFITLLFAFFVVMYAISQVNEGKYKLLSDALIQAFKPEASLHGVHRQPGHARRVCAVPPRR